MKLWNWRFLDTLRQDLTCAVRSYLKAPGTTLVLIVTLALGIGANTAVFSIINAVLLKPLPYPEPSRVMVFETTAQAGSPFAASPAKFNLWRRDTRVLEQVAAYQYSSLNLTRVDHPELLQAAQVSAD